MVGHFCYLCFVCVMRSCLFIVEPILHPPDYLSPSAAMVKHVIQQSVRDLVEGLCKIHKNGISLMDLFKVRIDRAKTIAAPDKNDHIQAHYQFLGCLTSIVFLVSCSC